MTNDRTRLTLRTCALFAVALCGLLTRTERAMADEHAFFERLKTHVGTLESVDEKAQSIIAEAVASLDDEEADIDHESLLIEVLVLISPEFRTALDRYDEDGATPENVASMKKLVDADDPYVKHNAELFVVRQLVELQQLVEAEERLAGMLKDVESFNAHAYGEADLHYMLGYCQLHNLKHDEAKRTLEDFLVQFPDASPRFVVTAKQMLAELARRVPESIGEVADLMSFSQKRLAAADTSERLQEAQQRVIELLDTLIEETEKQEQQQQSSSDPSQSQPQNKPQQNDPSQAPPQDSQSPTGGPQLRGKKAGRRVTPGDAWGAMPDADREKILQVLRERFPGRYRALVEQYYESLAEEP